jgi:hypothetical protein
MSSYAEFQKSSTCSDRGLPSSCGGCRGRSSEVSEAVVSLILLSKIKLVWGVGREDGPESECEMDGGKKRNRIRNGLSGIRWG